MTIMKQIDHCLTRAFNGKLPAPSKKWKAFIVKEFDGYHYLKVFHYQHLIMLIELKLEKYCMNGGKRGQISEG